MKWETKRVSEIAHHSLGKMLDKAKNKGEPKPYLRNLNVRWGEFDFSDVLEMRFLPDEAAKYTAVKGDVLICEGGYPGRAAVWDDDEPIYFQKALHRVRFHEPGRNKWFVYYLQFRDLEGTLRKCFNGAGIQHFTGEALARFEIPVPPLPEQQRIVGLLDKAFVGLATAQAHAERNLQNARALFESNLHSTLERRGEGWKNVKLGEYAAFKNGLNFNQRSKGQRLRIVGVGDFEDNVVVPTEALQSVTIDGVLSDDYLIRRDDILTVRSNGSKDLVGRCMIVPDLDERISYSGFVIRIRSDTAVVSPRFLLRYLKSSETRERLTRGGGGANISNINQAKLAELPIVLPPLKEQEEIADRLDAIGVETQRLEVLYQQKQAALAELKKSLLHRAFSGQL